MTWGLTYFDQFMTEPTMDKISQYQHFTTTKKRQVIFVQTRHYLSI